jgi:hypothetical protein
MLSQLLHNLDQQLGLCVKAVVHEAPSGIEGDPLPKALRRRMFFEGRHNCRVNQGDLISGRRLLLLLLLVGHLPVFNKFGAVVPVHRHATTRALDGGITR